MVVPIPTHGDTPSSFLQLCLSFTPLQRSSSEKDMAFKYPWREFHFSTKIQILILCLRVGAQGRKGDVLLGTQRTPAAFREATEEKHIA